MKDPEVKKHVRDVYEWEADQVFDDFKQELERWYVKKRAASSKAQGQLRERLKSEARIQRAEQEEKDRIAREKEEAKAEQERLEAEAEMDKLEPRDIPPEIRLEHTHILGPSGSGKTTLALRTYISFRHPAFS